jgi:predicted RNA-binding Zn-ribbon protein involved in translation (DUF1610 family)
MRTPFSFKHREAAVMITFPCRSCGQKLVMPEASAGSQRKCPHCGEPVLVPDSVTAAPSAEIETPVVAQPSPSRTPLPPAPAKRDAPGVRPVEAMPARAQAQQTPARHAAEWGLASLLVAGVLILMFPLMLIVVIGGDAVAWAGDVQGSDIDQAIGVGYLTGISLIGLGVLALFFGLMGLTAAAYRKQPFGLSVAGTLVSLGALFLAIMLMIVIVRIGDDLRKLQNQRRYRQRYESLSMAGVRDSVWASRPQPRS